MDNVKGTSQKRKVIFYAIKGGQRVVIVKNSMREVLEFLEPYKGKKLSEIFEAQNGRG